MTKVGQVREGHGRVWATVLTMRERPHDREQSLADNMRRDSIDHGKYSFSEGNDGNGNETAAG